MDGETWSEYEKLQSGGTPLAAIARDRFGESLDRIWPRRSKTGNRRDGRWKKSFDVPRHLLGLPDRHPRDGRLLQSARRIERTTRCR